MDQPVVDLLFKHEGFRPICYLDSRGNPTIGVGFNLDAASAAEDCQACGLDVQTLRNGQAITLQQALALLDIGIQRARDMAIILVRGFLGLPDNAQLVCIDMIFNLGSGGFVKFRNTIAAIEARNWIAAAAGMKDSEWYTQVGDRAKDDINLILHAGDNATATKAV